MRTTIDLPDELFRRAKATAAMRGLKLKEFLAAAIEADLDRAENPPSEIYGHRELPHLMIEGTGFVIRNMKNDEIFDLLDAGSDDFYVRPA